MAMTPGERDNNEIIKEKENRDERHRESAHKRRMEFWTGPGLTYVIFFIIITLSLAVFVAAISYPDAKVKELGERFILPVVTALLGLLAGRKVTQKAGD